MNEQSCAAARQEAALAPLSGHSRTIAKTSTSTQQKPMIRIVHLIAPEIIKTDVDNFRELVQRLTGKQRPSSRTHGANARINKIPRRNMILPAAIRSPTTTSRGRGVPVVDDREALSQTMARRKDGVDCSVHGKLQINEGEEHGKIHELELWMGNGELASTNSTCNSTTTIGGYFGGLGDAEGLLFDVPPFA